MICFCNHSFSYCKLNREECGVLRNVVYIHLYAGLVYVVIGYTSSYVRNVHAYKPVICCTHQSQSCVYVCELSSSLKRLYFTVELFSRRAVSPANYNCSLHLPTMNCISLAIIYYYVDTVQWSSVRSKTLCYILKTKG